MKLANAQIPTLKIYDHCVWGCVRKGVHSSLIALRHVLIRTRYCGLDLYNVMENTPGPRTSMAPTEEDLAFAAVIKNWIHLKRAQVAADEVRDCVNCHSCFGP